jgi:hypothetical protein
MSAQIMSKLHIPDDISISNDRNFFTLFMLFALIVLNHKPKELKTNKYFSNRANNVFSLILIINIILSGSRRGLFIFVFLLLIYLTFRIKSSLGSFNRSRFFRNVIQGLVAFLFVLLSGYLIVKTTSRDKITMLVYRYASFININDYEYIERLLWDRKKIHIPKGSYIIDDNLFGKHPELWDSPASQENGFELINTEYGPGYRIHTREGNNREFLLKYVGPELIYYVNHRYKISFKAKIVEGINPITVGWKNVPEWTTSEGIGVLYLYFKKEKINEDWYQYTATYTFNNNHYGIDGFVYARDVESELIIADFNVQDLHFNSDLPKFTYELRGEKDIESWINYYNPPLINDTSLINNGNFELGMRYWDYSANELEINIEEYDGHTVAHVKRGNGNNLYWSLLYLGRSILFKKDNEYQISFKYKPVSKHHRIPFNVGFYVDEGKGLMTNLPKRKTEETSLSQLTTKYLILSFILRISSLLI